MTEQPKIFDPKNLELLDFIVGDPKCNRADCGGRGYTGVFPDGSPKLCRCGKLLETDKVRTKNELKAIRDDMEILSEKLDHLLESQNNGFKILAAGLGEIHEKRLGSRLSRIWNKLFGMGRG